MNAPWILVVEDDPDIREAMQDALEGEGYGVATASNGREALELLERAEAPSLILLDLMMPVMSGGEFLTALRHGATCPDVPVVLVSAWPAEAAKLQRETQGYLKKPVSLDLLLESVSRFCRRTDAAA